MAEKVKLKCYKCEKEKELKEFTKFSRNPVYAKERYGYAKYCKDCSNEYVESRGNSFEALREMLLLQDIPYIHKIAEMAWKAYQEKLEKNTHGLSTTFFNCYLSKTGLIAKDYVNASFSDDIRTPEMDKKADMTQYMASKSSEGDKKTEKQKAQDYLKRLFGDIIYADGEKLSKACQLRYEQLGLVNENLNRQNKHRLKTALECLCNDGELDKKRYEWLFGVEEEEKCELEQPKIYDKDWKGYFSPSELEYLNDYYIDLNNDFKIITRNHKDYARKIAKASLNMDKAYDDMMNNVSGADKRYKEARETFDTLSKSAQFAENTRGQNDVSLGCFGKVFEKVEAHNWIPLWESLEEDDIDKLLKQFSNIEKSL